MKKVEAERVDEVLDRVLQGEHLEQRMLEHRALSLWGAVTGNYVNRLTTERRCANGVLSVRIVSAPARQELMMQRSSLIRSLNEMLGGDVIKEIKFF